MERRKPRKGHLTNTSIKVFIGYRYLSRAVSASIRKEITIDVWVEKVYLSLHGRFSILSESCALRSLSYYSIDITTVRSISALAFLYEILVDVSHCSWAS